MFYTSVVKIGNALGHRYIKDGKRHQEFIREFEYELFLKSSYSNDTTDVYGNTLKRYTFNTINEMAAFVKDNGEQNIYGNTDPVSQFISKTYPDEIKLTNDYVVLNFDIETEHGPGLPKYTRDHIFKGRRISNKDEELDLNKDTIKVFREEIEVFDEEKKEWVTFVNSCYAPKSLGFSDPNLALYEVMSVSLIDSRHKVIHVLGTKTFKGPRTIDGSDYLINYIECTNEKTLLVRFIQKWRDVNPDIITGWNIEGFDVPYMINRISRVLGQKYANMLSPYSEETKNCIREKQKDESVFYSILGITSYDYLSMYKKFSRDKRESYKLDFIGGLEVGHKKISYDEYDNSLMKLWEYDFDKFVLYNAIDTLIVNKLDEKLKFINLAITISHITKSDLSDATGTVKIWDNLIYNLLMKKNVQIIPNIKREKTGEFMGAFVKEPLYGRRGWTITHDLTSLYPSIIRGWNMSPETLVDREVGSNMYANRDILDVLSYNESVIEDIICNKDYTSESDAEIEIDIEKEFVSDDWDTLVLSNKNRLNELIISIEKKINYYNSGHNHIFDVSCVQDNILNFINMDTDISFAHEKNVTVAGNGSTYRKDIEGVIPAAMTMLFNYRKALKNEMKDKKRILQTKIEELHKLESKQ